jgi:hypothetical protein
MRMYSNEFVADEAKGTIRHTLIRLQNSFPGKVFWIMVKYGA